MEQRQQWLRSGGEQAWLALLVESFDAVARDPITSADAASLAALKLQLARPAACVHAGSTALH